MRTMGKYFRNLWGSLPHDIGRYYPRNREGSVDLWGGITETYGEAFPTTLANTTPLELRSSVAINGEARKQ